MFEVSGDTVCQASFEVCPDEFIGIKLRRVSGEVKSVESRTASEELFDKLCPVKRASIPEKDNGLSELAAKGLEELSDLFGSDVSVGIKTGVESKTFSSGRDGNSGDRRNLCPASGDNKNRRLSFDRPGSLDIGNERESALIQEGQAGSKLIGLFLYGARRDISSSGSPLPGVPWLSSSAPDSSNPVHSSDSRDCRRSNALESACELSDQYDSVSKGLSDNRLPAALSPRCVPKTSSGCPTKAKGVPYSELVLIPSDPSFDKLDANVPRSLKTNSVLGLPNDRFDPVSTGGWPDTAAFPAFGVCHEVS
jgi:hypothetical protein